MTVVVTEWSGCKLQAERCLEGEFGVGKRSRCEATKSLISNNLESGPAFCRTHREIEREMKTGLKIAFLSTAAGPT
jgi:hypothetical protein